MHRFAAALVVLAALCAVPACGGDDAEPRTQAERVAAGRETYGQICAACHGRDLRGTMAGPPFLHEIYRPDHHPDESFFTAVKEGVQPHHWDFGPMPPVLTLDDDEIAEVVAYIRAEQREAGIIGQG